MAKNMIDISIKNYDKLKKDIEKLEAGSKKAVSNIISDMKSKAPICVKKEVTQTYNINKKEITPGSVKKVRGEPQAIKQLGTMKVKGDTISSLVLIYEGRLLTPTHFNMTPTRVPALKKKSPKTVMPNNLRSVNKTSPFVMARHPESYDIEFEVFKGKRTTLEGKNSNIGNPFLTKGNGGVMLPFQRTSKKKDKYTYKIESIKTISVPQMIENKEVRGRIEKQLSNVLNGRVTHHMKRQLGMKL